MDSLSEKILGEQRRNLPITIEKAFIWIKINLSQNNFICFNIKSPSLTEHIRVNIWLNERNWSIILFNIDIIENREYLAVHLNNTLKVLEKVAFKEFQKIYKFLFFLIFSQHCSWKFVQCTIPYNYFLIGSGPGIQMNIFGTFKNHQMLGLVKLKSLVRMFY